MTERLFMLDPYRKEFDSKIANIGESYLILDKTCFYPQSGGQVGDTGKIGSVSVINTKYDENRENILHYVDSVSGFEVNQQVNCQLDWNRRYNIMKLHAASHIMEYFLFKIFGELKLLGCNVNDVRDSSTYEYSDDFDNNKLLEVQKLANEFIDKNHEIIRYNDPKNPNYWYWKAGCIVMPCGGTHPKSTKEIGHISIKMERDKKNKIKINTSFVID